MLAMIFLGIPLLYLESAVGQMHQKSISKIYEHINKGLKMFGYFCIFIAYNIATYYNTLLAYAYRYIFTAFLDPLPFIDEKAS
jgi:solute carrier family 6 serotonin transporter-like protein 4